MERLLDPSIPDAEFVALLDNVVKTFYSSPNLDEKNAAQRVLTTLQESADSWVRADKVLDSPYSSEQTKFFALQILGDMIKYRWKTLPRETNKLIQDYVVAKVIELSSNEETFGRESTYLGKLNLILVQIVKQEWPANWQSFMSDIVGASKTSTSRCENNLYILSLLSEEVFQFSSGQMTQEKTQDLKNQYNAEFAQVFELCQFVFDRFDTLKDTRPSVLIATLTTLERFLAWIPIGYILDTRLIETLLACLGVPALRNVSLKCLVEVASLSVSDRDDRFHSMYISFMQQLTTIVPVTTNIAQAYESAADDETETFIMNLALFLANFFRNHMVALGGADYESTEGLKLGMDYLVRVTQVSDVEVFKTCVEFWQQFTAELQALASGASCSPMFALISGHRWHADDGASLGVRMQVFREVLVQLRNVLISRVPKPEEVLIVEDENNEIVRETTKDTDALALYKTIKATLISLTLLDLDGTVRIVLDRLSMQMETAHWSWQKLNTLCWAVGSISGTMSVEMENKFLVAVLKDLLRLSDIKRGKDNKAVVASNIMYVVRQYPRFLRAHWKFLKTVVNKLFEFMHEKHPGIQDMACDTFLTIAKTCRREFVVTQPGEMAPFIEEILASLPLTIADLEPHHVHSFYEACGHVIAVCPSKEMQAQLVTQLFRLPNERWVETVRNASLDGTAFKQRQDMKTLVMILKTNSRVASSLGAAYFVQLRPMFPEMMGVYGTYSGVLRKLIDGGGTRMAASADARNVRAVKKEIVRLIEAFLATEESDQNGVMQESLEANCIQSSEIRPEVVQSIIDPMTMPILQDYYDSIPEVRDAEVLSLFSQVIVYMNGVPAETIRLIVNSLFACTLDMIKNNFEDFPDARLNLFKLLRTINHYNFSSLFMLDDNSANAEAGFQQVFNAIIWAVKHTERNVAETGLVILHELLDSVDESPHVVYFYQHYYRLVLNDILSVLTDTLHKPGFKDHALILMHILTVVTTKNVTVGGQIVPMWNSNDTGEVAMAGHPPSNQVFVKNHLEGLLRNAFPNMTPTQVATVVHNLFTSLNDYNIFKGHLRDFLVQTKEFSAGDNTDLYDDLKQAELIEKKQQEDERNARSQLTPAYTNT